MMFFLRIQSTVAQLFYKEDPKKENLNFENKKANTVLLIGEVEICDCSYGNKP